MLLRTLAMQNGEGGEAEAQTPEAVLENLEIVKQAEGLLAKITSGQFDQITTSEVWGVMQPIVVAVALLLGVLLVAGWAKKLTIRAASKARVEATLAKFFGNLVRWILLVVGFIAILGVLGIPTTSFAAVVAALGFAIGLALSGALGNGAAGVLLLIFRPFKVGDFVTTNGIAGTVNEIELFTTAFDTPDNRRIVVPNSKIFGETIENVSHHKTRRVQVDVGTAYGADIDRTREVLEQAARTVEGGLTDPAPVVYLSELGSSSVQWAVRVWCNSGDFWAVKERLTRQVKVSLDQSGIPIPFPQMDVYVNKIS